MKLTNDKLRLLFLICIIYLYHFFIQNGLEKIFSEMYFKYDEVKRPTNSCDLKINQKVSCIGMPSGHSDSGTIISYLLYYYNFIPLWVSVALIILISLQRFFANAHTISQIFVGIIIGLIYASIYTTFNLSVYAFILVFIIGLVFVTLSIYKLDSLVQKPIPEWVDKTMYPSIKKKQETPFYLKYLTIYTNAVLHNRTFVSWQDLEDYLDILIDKLREKDLQYNAVIGIKTGGAIISDYVSNKLGLPNYKVKLSKTDYNCDKKPINTINEVFHRQVLNHFGDYSLCEGIDDDLTGKNIILIDEMVSSGKTMDETMKYLRNEKHVNIIQPTCVSFSKRKFKYDYKIDYVLPTMVFVWPWGYDN